METKQIDRNSIKSQDIKRRFVEREILMNMNYWVDDYQNNNECWFDEFENLYKHKVESSGTCKHCEDKRADLNYDGYCADCADWETQEILEYWAVTEFMYKALKERGDPVAEINNTYIWGRTCSGQSILLDSVISDICESMEILEGQKYEWKV